MKFQSKLSNIKIGGKKPDKQENEIKNIANLYNAGNEVIKFYNDYSLMIFNAGYDAIHGKGLEILTPKQILETLPISLAQVKVGNSSENLLNEICEIIYFLYQAKGITKKLYKNVMNSVKV